MPPYEQSLGDGLTLRSVRDERDAQRYVAFFRQYHTHRAARTAEELLHHHPATSLDGFLFVEHGRTGELVATTGLIPWHCRYEEATLDVAQLEMVVARPEYRRRGLIRAQIQRFHQMVLERGFHLSLIEGIPYYYRQFGYTYAIDHRGYDSLPVWCIPDVPTGLAGRYALRPATPEDAPLLTELYREAMAPLQFAARRDEGYWRFLLERAQYPVRLVERRPNGYAVGYVVTAPLGDQGGLRVLESAVAEREAGLALLAALKGESAGEIQLGWPESGTLVQIGRSLGGAPLPAYQWLLRIPDVPRLLAAIGPCLERRLAASPCARLTADIRLNLYREAFSLRFQAGKLAGAEPLGFVDSSMGADGGDLCIPPEAFVRLVTGYRRLGELYDSWPDIVVKPAVRQVIEVLFPRMSSYLCMPYLYLGPLDR